MNNNNVKIYQKVADFFIFGNYWIGICAASCAWAAEWLGLGQVSASLLLLLFFATFFRYNLIGFTVTDGAESAKFKYAWKHRKLLRLYAIAGGIGSLLCSFFLGWSQLFLLSHLAILSIWYLYPMPCIAPPLRKIPYLKIFLISHVWACSIYLLPYFGGQGNMEATELALGYFERFLFIFCITIPFDIRDLSSDKKDHTKTLPLALGVKGAKLVGAWAALLGLFFCAFMYSLPTFLGMALGYGFALLLLALSSTRKGDLYYLGFVDGLCVVQSLAIAASNWLFVYFG